MFEVREIIFHNIEGGVGYKCLLSLQFKIIINSARTVRTATDKTKFLSLFDGEQFKKTLRNKQL